MGESFDQLLLLLTLIPAYYLAVPILVGLGRRIPASPMLTELDLEELEPHQAQFLMTHTRTLYELGFDEPTLVRIARVPYVKSYIIMLVNRRTGDKAMVSAVVAEGPIPLQTLYVEFSTRFDTGEVFDTHNSRTLPAFPPAPLAVRTQVPSVVDLRELYQLHTFVMDKHDVRGKKVLYAPGQALNYLLRFVFGKVYEAQVERGLLYFDQKSSCYRYTFKGSYLIIGGLMRPFKALRTMALNRRARAILKEFRQNCSAIEGSAHNEHKRGQG